MKLEFQIAIFCVVKFLLVSTTFGQSDISSSWKLSVRLRIDEITELANQVMRFDTRKFLANQNEEFKRQILLRIAESTGSKPNVNEIYSVFERYADRSCEFNLIQDSLKEELTLIENPTELSRDILNSFCIRNTNLSSAFHRIDEFYILTQQNLQDIQNEIETSPADTNCNEYLSVVQVTKLKLFDLIDSMVTTDDIVHEMFQAVRSLEFSGSTLQSEDYENFAFVVVKSLSKTFVKTLRRNGLLTCFDANGTREKGTTPRQLFSTFSNTILNPSATVTPKPIVVSTGNVSSDGGAVFVAPGNTTDTETSILVGGNYSIPEGSNVLNVFNSNSPVLVGPNHSEQSPQPLPKNPETDSTPVSKASTAVVQSGATVDLEMTSTAESVTSTTSWISTTTPFTGSTIVMTPRSTRPTGPTTTTTTSTVSESTAPSRINPSLLNLLGRGG